MRSSLGFVLCAPLFVLAAMTCAPSSSAQEQAAADEIYEIHNARENGITAPKPLYHPDPEYTDKARKKKINGTVLLSIVVTPDGAVRDARVTTKLDEGLDQQAIKTVKTWKFQPATKDGKPVSVRVAVEMTFKIR